MFKCSVNYLSQGSLQLDLKIQQDQRPQVGFTSLLHNKINLCNKYYTRLKKQLNSHNKCFVICPGF